MERIPLDEVRKNVSDVIQMVSVAKQRFLVHVDGEDQAAFVPLEDFELLESMDGGKTPAQQIDLEGAARHLKKDIAQIAECRERILLQKDGVDIVALVPRRDLALLEGLDNRLRLEAAKRILDRQMNLDL